MELMVERNSLGGFDDTDGDSIDGGYKVREGILEGRFCSFYNIFLVGLLCSIILSVSKLEQIKILPLWLASNLIELTWDS